MKKIIIGLSICIICVFAASCHVGDPGAPGTPRDLQFVCDLNTGASVCDEANTRILTWIASGDDGNKGQALQYDMRWATQLMTSDVYTSSNQFINEPAPQTSGTREFIFMPRMYPGVDLSFGLRSLDEVALTSGIVSTGLVKMDFVSTPLGADGATAAGFGSMTDLLLDLNGLGTYDLAVGAPQAVEPVSSEARGALFLYFNGSAGYLLTTVNGMPRSADELKPAAVIYGEAAGDRFGESFSSQSDFNGDGIVDLAVGAPGAGKVYIFLGGSAGQVKFSTLDINPASPAKLDASDADIIISKSVAEFGASVALLGELNGKAGSELLIGSPTEGAAYIFYGGLLSGNGISGAAPLTVDLSAADFADWTIIGPAGSDFGKLVSRVGDFNADGAEDLIVSAPNMDLAYLFFGGFASAIDFSLTGPQTDDLSSGGDFDLLLEGEAGSSFGSSIAGRLSLNPSSSAVSIAIGAPGLDKVYVLYGYPSAALTFPIPLNTTHNVELDGADETFTGEALSRFGASLTSINDFDGNGTYDLLVGAPLTAKTGGTTPGAVYEFLTLAGKPLDRVATDADCTIWGKTDNGQFGASVAGVGQMIAPPNIIRETYLSNFIAGAPAANAAYAEY